MPKIASDWEQIDGTLCRTVVNFDDKMDFVSQERQREILGLHQAGVLQGRIVKLTGCSRDVVSMVIKSGDQIENANDYPVPTVDNTPKQSVQRLTAEERDEIMRLNAEGNISAAEISRRINHPRKIVDRLLRKVSNNEA